MVRATVSLPKGMALLEGDRSIAVSPDGARVVVSLHQKDATSPPSLHLRELSRLEFRALPGTDEATYPFWSPDGKSIAFFAGRKLKRIDLADGIVRVLSDAPAGRGGSWGPKGSIVFAPSAGGGLFTVSDAGGAASPITTTETLGESHRFPSMLPDGQRFLYYRQNTAEDGVYAYDPATKQSRPVLPGATEAFFVEPGSLVFVSGENLMVQPFDAVRLELTGNATPIATGVRYNTPRAFINAGITPRGALVYQQAAQAARFRLAWMDRKGERTPVPAEPIPIGTGGVSLSSDARRAAVAIAGNRSENTVAILDMDRGVMTTLGEPGVAFYFNALVAPDPQSLIAVESRNGVQSIVTLPIGGGAGTRILTGEPGYEYSTSSITPDGKTLLFVQVPLRDKSGDIMTLSLGGDPVQDRPASRFMQTPDAEWNPRISPSGDMVAYSVSKEEDVGSTLRVVAYPTPSAPIQVTAAPVSVGFFWLGPGELCWIDTSRRVWSATVATKDGRIDVGLPKPMFEGRQLDKQFGILDVDIPRDRFLIAIEDEPREDPRIILVSDWRAEPGGAQAARK